jgi:hypothetical protein
MFRPGFLGREFATDAVEAVSDLQALNDEQTGSSVILMT